MAINVFAVMAAAPIEAQAADYATTLRNKGFPESYIPSLVALHDKYPNWIFEPLKTNMDFQYAVNKERSPHSNQVIEKLSYTDSSMFCSCSSCMKNGSYIIQERPNWISASEKAVQYYMDPRNFLNEQGIFQFESTQYNGTQTQAGVEAILAGTWMHNAKISYSNTEGQTVTMSSTYSAAIMDAAKNSGMSAYYLASKIKQEVGASKPTAGGASGTVSPFQGIFNYYNICAYTGAMDGLEWAAGYLRTNKATTMYSGYDENTKKGTGTATALKEAQYMTIISFNDNNYYKVRLYDESTFKAGAVGYVAKNDIRTYYTGGQKSPGWGRPWYTPYLSIYHGAQYIFENFKTQYTGYLQKFNVNPASGSAMHTHEYMRNVAGAASEAQHTYTAYKNAGILSLTNTFYIPVYNNMPIDTLPAVTGLKASSNSTSQIDLTWNAVSDATAYRVMIDRNGTYETYANVSTNKLTVTGLNAGQIYGFKVIACSNKNGNVIWGESWTECLYAPMLAAVTGLSTTVVSSSQLDVKWNKLNNVTGYKVQINKNGTFEDYATVYTNSVSIKGLSGGQEYSVRVMGFRNYYSNTYLGISWSTTSNTTTLNSVTGLKAVSSDSSSVSLEWNKVTNATGYRVLINKNGTETYSDITDNKIKITGLSGNNSYTVKVIAFKKHSGKTYWGTWSTITVQTSMSNVTGIKAQNQTTSSVEFTWNTVANATGYKVQFNKGGTFVDYATTANNKVTITGLTPGQICTIRIKPYVNKNGTTILGNSWTECTNAATLETISNLKASGVTNGQITLTWNEPACVTGYRVQISKDGNFGNDFKTTYTNKITLSGLENNQTYSIRVLGFRNFNGSTYWSKGWAYTTADGTQLSNVTALKAQNQTTSSVEFTWNTVANATGYKVQFNKGGTFVDYATTANNKVTITGLTPGQICTIRVIAYRNTSNTTIQSSAWTECTNAATLETVTNIVVTDAGSGQLDLTWKQLSAVTGYRVQISTNGSYGNDYFTTYTNKISLKNLNLGQKYSIRILGFRNFNGNTYWSKGWAYTTASTSTLLAPVTELKAVSNTAGQIDLSWSKDTRATGYRVQIYRNGTYQNYGTVADNKISITGLKSGERYTFKVLSFADKSGNTYWTRESAVITAAAK
ncbi:MAG: fibronectin type III domain-containing protein [Eubacterium sp.]|nr:fibronectin type III domain-containing protein [Eubacterium sp.]